MPSSQAADFQPPPGATDQPDQAQQPDPADPGDPAGLYGSPAVPPPARRRRKGLLIGLVAVGVLVLLAVVGGVVFTVLNRIDASSSFAVGSCVKQDGKGAKRVKCAESGAFQVVSKEDKRESCPDQGQPSVLIERGGGKTEVLCLRPAGKK